MEPEIDKEPETGKEAETGKEPQTGRSQGSWWVVLSVCAAAALVIGLMAGYLLWGGAAAGPAPTTAPAGGAARATAPAPAAAKGPTLWTCSMHPQIRLPKPGFCPICKMRLIPLEASDSAGGGLRVLTVSEAAKKLMAVETVPVERRFVEARVRMVGKVDYDETRLKYVTAWVPGRLDRLYVDYTGVPVRKGDHLVYIYSPELLTAQEELIQAARALRELKDSGVGIVRESTEATLVAAREKLRLLGLKPEQIAAVEKSGKATDHLTIYSPIGGIVVHKNAQEGMYVNTGTRIYTVADLSQVWIRLDAYEADLAWLRYGQHVEFTTEAYPGETFTGTIAFIDPILTQTTRTVKVRVNAPNAAMRLKPGMFVRAVARAKVAAGGKVMEPSLANKWICPMHPDVVKDAPGRCDLCEMPLVRTESLGYASTAPSADNKPLVIPTSAALVTGKRAIVYVRLPGKDKPTFEGREIVLGPRAGDYYLVRHGLAEGEQVVTKGAFKIDAELQIQARPSAMTPEGGGGGGGDHHGGMKKAAPGKEKKSTAMELPAVVQHQLRAVLAAGKDVEQALAGGEIEPVRSAFGRLGAKVRAVEADALTGHPAMLWKEYAMLLGNDAVVGADARTLADAREAAGALREHLASMRAKLGLTPAGAPATAPSVPPAFRAQFGAVVREYLAAQAALAKDDPNAARTHGKAALEALGGVEMTRLTGEAHMAWMKAAEGLEKALGEMVAGKDIQAVREAFAVVSELTAAAARRFQPAPYAALYELKCPMAFDNRGATWLQADREVRNPYFGDAMPGCGEVVEVLSFPRAKAPPGPAASQPAAWTCPMHPEVRLPGPGRCPRCNMELIPAGPGANSPKAGGGHER